MTQRILCPVDFSECSHAALAQALTLAEASKSRVDVLHAYYVPANIQPHLLVWATTGLRPLQEVAEEQARAELDAFLAQHGPDIGQRIDLHVVHQDPKSAIVNFAKDHRSSLIVMGTHGRTGPSRLFMGSVAERVVRSAPCPVLTVRERLAEAVVEKRDDARASASAR